MSQIKKEISNGFSFPSGSVAPTQEGTYAPLLRAVPYGDGVLIRAIVFCDPTSEEPQFGTFTNGGNDPWTCEISYTEPGVSSTDNIQVWYLETVQTEIPQNASIEIYQSGGPKTSRGTVVVSQSTHGELENK